MRSATRPKLEVDAQDEEAFSAAKDWLLQHFAGWVGPDAAELVADASIALDWKCRYADGNLVQWRVADLAEYLLEWCPRKLSIDPSKCGRVLEGLSRFVAFLAAEGLLAQGSAPLHHLDVTFGEIAGPFVAAMGDPSKFGMAKSLFAGVGPDFDVTDQAAMQRHIDAHNALPEEERRRRLPDSALGIGVSGHRPPEARRLPPVALADEARYAASAAQAPILATFARFAQFVGAGRKLTQTGQITLADARVLVDLLETGDVMDRAIGDRVFKTVSSAELVGLRQIVAWARKAGVVRVANGRVLATKKAGRLAVDPVASFEAAVAALLAIGPLASQRDTEGWMSWPAIVSLLDEGVPLLLVEPYVLGEPVPVSSVEKIAVAAVLDAYHFDRLSDADVARRVRRDVTDIISVLVQAGVLTRQLDEPDGDVLVELTPAGRHAVRRMVLAMGIEAPVAGRLAGGTAVELLHAVYTIHLTEVAAEADAWRARRTPTEAAKELAEAAGTTDDFVLQNLALGILTDVGVEVAEPFVRAMTADPRMSGLARCWLVDQGCDDLDSLYDPDDLAAFVLVLAHRLVRGPDDLAAVLAIVGDPSAQLGLLDRIWKVPNPMTGPVLDGIGSTHPSKATAKAARKAALRHRSWLANQ